MQYDLAYGPPNPRAYRRTRPTREWEDPMAWVDLLIDAPGQVAANVEFHRLWDQAERVAVAA